MKNKEKLGVLNIDTTLYKTRISRKFEERITYKAADPKNILSFIPGTVLDILVSAGQNVSKGDDLMVLDAMKMQNRLKSPVEGTVKQINVQKGTRVAKGVLLIEIS